MTDITSKPNYGEQLVDEGGKSLTALQLYLDDIELKLNELQNTVIETSETSISLSSSNLGSVFTLTTSSSAVTVTIPTEANGNFADGVAGVFQQKGTGTITFAGSGGVTIESAGGNLSTTEQHSVVSVLYQGSDVWTLFGAIS